MKSKTDVCFNACPSPSSLCVYQPPPQVCSRVWRTPTEGCAEPDPWSWCWGLDRVSSLSASAACDGERDAAPPQSVYSPSWGAIFPDELSQIPTAGSLRPSVLSRLCDYLDWLQRLIISPPCIIATSSLPPMFLLLIDGQKQMKQIWDVCNHFMQSSQTFSRHPPQPSSAQVLLELQ